MIILEIPSIPPSVNALYVRTRGGGRSLSATGRAYKRQTIAHLATHYPNELRFFEKNKPYGFYIVLFLLEVETKGWKKRTADRYKSFDVSNRVKVLEDCVVEATGVDDKQNMVVCIEKRVGLVEMTKIVAWNMEADGNPIVAPFSHLGI